MRSYFADYETYHRTSGNRACHWLGIPPIMLAVLGLFAHWVLLAPWGDAALIRMDAGVVVLALSMLWYVKRDWRLGLPFSFVGLSFYFVGRAIPSGWLWGLFVAGWIFQTIGHAKYEKKSPAFFKSAEHLLVGPIWLFAKLVGYPYQ
jgi:uncharacterized membrane protein YGL010W